MGILSEIGSLVTTTATGGMSIVTKYMAELGVVLALLIGAFFYGHHVAATADKAAILAAANKAQTKVITITKKENVIDTNTVGALSTALANANAQNAKLQRDLSSLKRKQLTTVDKNGECTLSKPWIDLYNQSIH
jgi:hypothetical protein